MPRMRDMIKSISDVQKDSEKKDQKKKPDEDTGLSGLDAIKNALKEGLQYKSNSKIFKKETRKSDISLPSKPKPIQPKKEKPIKIPSPPPKDEDFEDKSYTNFTQEIPKPQISPSPSKITSILSRKLKPVKITSTPPKAEDFEDKSFSDKLYMDYHRLLGTIVNDIKSEKLIDPKPLEKNISDLIEANNASEFLFMKAIQRKRFATWVVSHSVNVTIFALKIGVGLKYKKDYMHQLAIASLLHDVGMVKVPNRILFKHGKLSSDEYDVIRQHPIHGYEIVKHLKDDYPDLLNAVYQEQEREDGSGYPQGLKGDKISEFAKIIGTADIFEALVHGRTYREGFVTYYAIQNILETKSHQFSPKMIRSLISVISMFPLGSLVELNTGEIARVVVTNRNRPVRPIVEISEDLEGRKLDPPNRVNLEKEPLIYITKPIIE